MVCSVQVDRISSTALLLSGTNLKQYALDGLPVVGLKYRESKHPVPCRVPTLSSSKAASFLSIDNNGVTLPGGVYLPPLFIDNGVEGAGILPSDCSILAPIDVGQWCPAPKYFVSGIDLDGDSRADELCAPKLEGNWSKGFLMDCKVRLSRLSMSDITSTNNCDIIKDNKIDPTPLWSIVDKAKNVVKPVREILWLLKSPIKADGHYAYLSDISQSNADPLCLVDTVSRAGSEALTPCCQTSNSDPALPRRGDGTCLTHGMNYTSAKSECNKNNNKLCTRDQIASFSSKDDTCAAKRTRFWSSETCSINVREADFLHGPTELKLSQCLERRFDISSSASQSVHSIYFHMKLWLPGEWDVRRRNYDISVYVQGVHVWSLGSKIVCARNARDARDSKLNEFKGYFEKDTFSDHHRALLSNYTCFVEISHRMAVDKRDNILVQVCREGTTSARRTYVGVSHARIDITGLGKPVASGTFHATSNIAHAIGIPRDLKMTRSELHISGKHCFNKTNASIICGPESQTVSRYVRSDKNPFHLEVKNKLKSDDTPIGLLLNVTRNGIWLGPPIDFLRVSCEICKPTKDVCEQSFFDLKVPEEKKERVSQWRSSRLSHP